MRDFILFYLNGKRIHVTGDEVFLTLSDYLRKRCGLIGTKVVCAEGDCGSCTVLIGRPDGGEIIYQPVTSCIQILFQLDATHVVTVEGLRAGDQLNPIQQALVDCHGTQCGFCTPGFVVALHSMLSEERPPDPQAIRRRLTGNLCRCTGYDSIIKAALSVDRTAVESVGSLYSSPAIYSGLLAASLEPVRIETADRKFFKPVTLQAASQYRSENPDCSVVAGGTDLCVVYNKHLLRINVALSLAGLSSLRSSLITPDRIHIGAGCSLTQLKALADEHLPELGRFMDWFGSPLIRNAGTVGGNLVTGSPIGDTIPAWIALGAEIEITGLNGSRIVPVGQFYTGYRQTVLIPDEFVTAVKIPIPKKSDIFRLYKISRRKDLDISSFNTAIWMRITEGIVSDVRIAMGGVGPIVMRLTETEAILLGQSPGLNFFKIAGECARAEVKPISDVRGSADYRRTLAENILIKFWHEAFRGAGSMPELPVSL